MTADEIAKLLDGLLERLAAIEHERWSHWQRYLHSKGIKQADGSLLLPKTLVEQWEHQIATDYDKLTDKEKESDREQVRKYLPIIAKGLAG
jgi:hypothetical protein